MAKNLTGLVLADFPRFIRIETCLFISCIAASGFLLFGRALGMLLWAFLSVFFACGAGYALNHMTDMGEDAINNRKISRFAGTRTGWLVVMVFSAAGFCFSLFLPFTAFIMYAACLLMTAAYSLMRIKKRLLLKNAYTGFNIAGSFMVGATAAKPFAFEMIGYAFFAFIFGFLLNLLGDIRGCAGDRVNDVRTIPVVLGENAAKKVAYGLAAVFSASVTAFGYVMLYPLVPFMLAISFFLHRNEHKKSRAAILSSFVFLSLFLMAAGFAGGV